MGKTFELEVFFDCYSNEEVTDVQKKALVEFLANIKEINEIEMIVTEYCEKMYSQDAEENKTKSALNYVLPTQIYIRRTKSDERCVALLCDYCFSNDNGLAIVFKNEKLSRICSQNTFL